jgi:hypothetical protein
VHARDRRAVVADEAEPAQVGAVGGDSLLGQLPPGGRDQPVLRRGDQPGQAVRQILGVDVPADADRAQAVQAALAAARGPRVGEDARRRAQNDVRDDLPERLVLLGRGPVEEAAGGQGREVAPIGRESLEGAETVDRGGRYDQDALGQKTSLRRVSNL